MVCPTISHRGLRFSDDIIFFSLRVCIVCENVRVTFVLESVHIVRKEQSNISLRLVWQYCIFDEIPIQKWNGNIYFPQYHQFLLSHLISIKATIFLSHGRKTSLSSPLCHTFCNGILKRLQFERQHVSVLCFCLNMYGFEYFSPIFLQLFFVLLFIFVHSSKEK